MTGFSVFTIGVIYVFSQVYNNPIILYVGATIVAMQSFISYWYSDKIVLSISGAMPIEANDNQDLYRLVENLCITAGLPIPKIYIIDDLAPNAFATGRDPKHAAIAVTSGLLQRLNRSELEGVVAHELSHIGNRDILLSTIVVILVGFISLISDLFLRMSLFGGRSRDDENKSGGFLMLIYFAVMILSPVVGMLIHMTISRKREYLADASGALLTRYPEGLASALEKISEFPLSMTKASKATAHLYIASPFKGKDAAGFVAGLFMTHPPIEERVQILRGMDVK